MRFGFGTCIHDFDCEIQFLIVLALLDNMFNDIWCPSALIRREFSWVKKGSQKCILFFFFFQSLLRKKCSLIFYKEKWLCAARGGGAERRRRGAQRGHCAYRWRLAGSGNGGGGKKCCEWDQRGTYRCRLSIVAIRFRWQRFKRWFL